MSADLAQTSHWQSTKITTVESERAGDLAKEKIITLGTDKQQLYTAIRLAQSHDND